MPRKFLAYRLPAILYAGLLFYASSRSRLPMPNFGLGFEDKIIHLVAFALLAYLVHRALTLPTALVRAPYLWSLLLSAAYALSDEVHQRSVPGRQFDMWDWAADVAGIGLVLLYLRLKGKSGADKA